MANQEEEESKLCPVQLLSTLYTLDKSYTTEIIVGLEYSNLQDEYYRPVVQLLGYDSKAITFNANEWVKFTKCFNDFFKYLCEDSSSSGDYMTGQQICGTGWTAKFTHSKKDRVIEIVDASPPRTFAMMRTRHHSTIVLKKAKFLRLYEYIVKCIDARLEYLKFVAVRVSCMARETVEYIKSVNPDTVPVRKFGFYTISLVKAIINLIDDKWFDTVTATVQTRAMEMKDQIPFSRNDIVDIFYQLVSHHLDEIVNVLNEMSDD